MITRTRRNLSLPVLPAAASILLSERISKVLALAKTTRTTMTGIFALKGLQLLSMTAKKPAEGPIG